MNDYSLWLPLASVGDQTSQSILCGFPGCDMCHILFAMLRCRCNVRSSCSKSITLHNTSSSAWQLHPVIQNNMWSGPEFLKVPAAGKAEYNMTYKPVTMSGPDTPHEGSVFFPIPDGTGLLYRLAGQVRTGAVRCSALCKTLAMRCMMAAMDSLW